MGAKIHEMNLSRAFSSMAERSLDVRKAVGSIPTRRINVLMRVVN